MVLCFQVAEAATWKKLYNTSTGVAVTTAITTCPTGYIGVPALVPYTIRFFCVAKYEMKNDGYGTAVSVAAGAPWINITRGVARSSCQNLGAGYDLISNDQWQTIARNIAGVASNWSGAAVGSGAINQGHSDNAPNALLNASTDDVAGNCTLTGQTCSSTVWNAQRRTHTLSNGNVIWDLAGNAAEWVTNYNTYSYTPDTFASQLTSLSTLQTAYGPLTSTICATPAVAPYCGFGKAMFTGGDIGIESRGGTYSVGNETGIFTADLRDKDVNYWADTGFRCVYVP